MKVRVKLNARMIAANIPIILTGNLSTRVNKKIIYEAIKGGITDK